MTEPRSPARPGPASSSTALRRAIAWLLVDSLVGLGVLALLVLPAWYHDGASATSVFWTVAFAVLCVLAWRRLGAARAAWKAQDAARSGSPS